MSKVEELKLYRPSNGTEGMSFIADHCDQCIHDNFPFHKDKNCDILCATMVYDINDPEYPKEWCYVDDKPTCTKWVKWDWGNEDDGWNEPPPYPDEPDPMQLCFPFILEFMEYEIYEPELIKT